MKSNIKDYFYDKDNIKNDPIYVKNKMIDINKKITIWEGENKKYYNFLHNLKIEEINNFSFPQSYTYNKEFKLDITNQDKNNSLLYNLSFNLLNKDNPKFLKKNINIISDSKPDLDDKEKELWFKDNYSLIDLEDLCDLFGLKMMSYEQSLFQINLIKRFYINN